MEPPGGAGGGRRRPRSAWAPARCRRRTPQVRSLCRRPTILRIFVLEFGPATSTRAAPHALVPSFASGPCAFSISASHHGVPGDGRGRRARRVAQPRDRRGVEDPRGHVQRRCRGRRRGGGGRHGDHCRRDGGREERRGLKPSRRSCHGREHARCKAERPPSRLRELRGAAVLSCAPAARGVPQAARSWRSRVPGDQVSAGTTDVVPHPARRSTLMS